MSKKSKHKSKGPRNPPQNKPSVEETEVQENKDVAETSQTQQLPQKQPEIIVQREPVNVPEPKNENPIEKEESPSQIEETPVKPKRNRGNRRKKHNNQEIAEEQITQQTIVQPKQEAPPENKVEEIKEVKDVAVMEKEQPEKQEQKSKKGKKEKTETKSTPISEEKLTPEPAKPIIAEPAPQISEHDDFVESKGAKNKKGKNKKNKENKEIQSTNESTKTDISEPIEIKSEVKESNSVLEVPSEIPTIVPEQIKQTTSEVQNCENVQKNKKGKKNDQSKQKQHKETSTNISKVEVESPKIDIIEEQLKHVKLEEQTKISTPVSEEEIFKSGDPEKIESIQFDKTVKGEVNDQKSSNKKDTKNQKHLEEKKNDKNQCPLKIEEKPKCEKTSQSSTETTDDNLTALASSIEKTLEELIVCESDILLSEQLKSEEEKKDKNKKKSKKEKHTEKLEPVMEIKEKSAEILPIQPDVEIVTNVPEIKTDLPPEQPTSDQKTHQKSEIKENVDAKTEKLEVKHLDVQDRKSPSKSPTRKDKRRKSPKPATVEIRDSLETKQEIQSTVSFPQQKEEIISPVGKDASQNLDVGSENAASTYVEQTVKPEIKNEFNIITSSVPEQIINTLLSDIPPPLLKEDAKCEAKNVEEKTVKNKCKKEKAHKESGETHKKFPIELDSDAGSNQIESSIENEMKKALEVAIGAVGDVPISENIDVVTEQKSVAEIKSDTVEEQKTCEKSEQNKHEIKSKSKKNKNKQTNQEETKTVAENILKTETCPITECGNQVQTIIESPKEIKEETPSPAIIIPSTMESVSIITPPTVGALSEEIKLIEKDTVDEKPQKDNLKPNEQKHRTPSPKPNKRNKNKKNKQGENNDNQTLISKELTQESQPIEKIKEEQNKSKINKDDSQKSEISSSQTDTQAKEQTLGEEKKQLEQSEVTIHSDSEKKPENKQTELKEGKGKNKQKKSAPDNQSKNPVGPTDSPAKSNKYDYKKEKNKGEDSKSDSKAKSRTVDKGDLPETSKEKSVERIHQVPSPKTDDAKRVVITELEDGKLGDDEDEEFVYKYSFRTVFIANACHICKIQLKDDRVVCRFCHLVSYCTEKHRDDDWQTHQSLCYAICTISHAKEQNYIYGDSKSLNGHDYRLLRMQTIVSCEKMLKRKLCPWEQEALLYPRICSLPSCREWKSGLLKDCEGCGQVSYCSANPAHLGADHINWCKAYKLYYKLVAYQLNHGRLEPELPVKIPPVGYLLPDNSQALFQELYDNVSNIEECNYATLTQLSTAPLTALYAYQKFKGVETPDKPLKQNFCIHLIGAELQFEGDTLKKWEVFFMHFMQHVKELTVVLIGPELNTSKLPVELLSKIKLCQSCKQADRKIKFDFAEGMLYHDYIESEKFIRPDIVCALNPGFHRATGYAGLDTWPETIAGALRLKVPLCITAYTSHEMPRDLDRVKTCAPNKDKLRVIIQPGPNPYSSLRPDRNFVSDDEMPLIFKNYHISLVISE